MNTPSHLILNLCALGRRDAADTVVPIAVGAVLPDAAMFVFYAVEKLWLGASEQVIWTTRYFAPAWQDFFDLFNSVPIIAAGFGISFLARNRPNMLLFASMGLHVLLDLPLHHDDGHRHFHPISDWRFASPVSYWDPNHYGYITAPLEFAVALAGGVVLGRRHPSRRARIALGALAALYGAFIAFALVTWV